MELYHFSSEHFELLRSYPYGPQTIWRKPFGLWVSDESDFGWSEWLSTEGDFNARYLVRYEVEIDLSDVLVIDDKNKFIEFSDSYKSIHPDHDYFMHIDWKKVAERYKGIIISPYFWSFRLDDNHIWYYGWDVASGCIWDLSAVENILLSDWENTDVN